MKTVTQIGRDVLSRLFKPISKPGQSDGDFFRNIEFSKDLFDLYPAVTDSYCRDDFGPQFRAWRQYYVWGMELGLMQVAPNPRPEGEMLVACIARHLHFGERKTCPSHLIIVEIQNVDSDHTENITVYRLTQRQEEEIRQRAGIDRKISRLRCA